jgi:hypothetical protein
MPKLSEWVSQSSKWICCVSSDSRPAAPVIRQIFPSSRPAILPKKRASYEFKDGG